MSMSAGWAHAKTVTVVPADNRTDVSLNLGDTLVVELATGEVRGFQWISHLAKGAPLTLLNDNVLSAKQAGAKAQIRRFRFNAAMVGDTPLAFGFESAEKVAGAAPQDTSSFLIRVHVASGAPRDGSAVLSGVYKGTLPCGDCSGLDTVLKLYAKGKYDTTDAFYIRTQTYRGAPKGDLTLADRGEWTVLRGDATDPDATVYQLNPEDEQHSEFLLVQQNSNALTQLDHDQKPIPSKGNLTLRRVAQSQ